MAQTEALPIDNTKKIKAGKNIKRGILNIFLGVYALLTLYPLIWLFISAFKSNNEIYAAPFALPESLKWDNFVRAWEVSGMGKAMINSFIVTIVSLALLLVLGGALVAYAISRFQFKFRNAIYALLLFGLLIPVHSTLVPLFTMMNEVKILDTYLALILPYFSFELPIAVFLLAAFMGSFSKEMEEAAFIDGCGYWGIFWKIMFPLSLPALSTVGIIGFLRFWNEFAFALVFINDSALRTIPLTLSVFSTGYSTDYSLTLAAMAISVIPVVVLFLIMQDRIMQGMVAGAVKG
ncbi:sugar ABC transporter permease [Gracilibacillus boraciitolerans JCM 21714]|uniref:Sugar ABC transporter permease n=1 Tax=Gracilibacillus boraciitolerans JCM 21714 TaxID=1298598 RepID=W4VQP0_9BACI|nr:carbohydrate ABC transporter permease [Gracilibacillus boraciitolerans]GAE95243.1 sugar ABC transporter permease [Gracilibacillus boraciitolerans JCM 21714]